LGVLIHRPEREVTISSALYEEILSGRGSRERKLAVCGSSSGLTDAQHIELLAALSEDSDKIVRERAAESLAGKSASDLTAALEMDFPAAALFRYCATFTDKPEVALALAKHPRCSPDILPKACLGLSPAGIQHFFNDLDFLSSSPALMGALLRSQNLSPDQHEQLSELLEKTDKKIAAAAEADLDGDSSPRERRVTLLQRLANMRVVERVQLALKGGREERLALIRDPCKVVQRAVLQSPRLSDREVESFAAMANLSDDVLRLIGRNRAFVGNPIVVRNLLNNPKTPLEISLHFLPNTTGPELKALTLNRNIPETLRSMALRLHRQRSLQRA
jgi:hypothetical protein